MNSLKFISILIIGFASSSYTQKNNLKIETVKVYGNCTICENAIEKAGSIKKIAHIDWNKDSKIATIKFDSVKTSKQAVLERIALAGYDNESFLAPDDTYASLQECCQYVRAKNISQSEKPIIEIEHKPIVNIKEDATKTQNTIQKESLKIVFDNYFKVKDALVQSDQNSAATKAKELLNSIEIVKMNELETDVHLVWMKVLPSIKKDVEAINTSKNLDQQRKAFISLSESMYQLAKTIKVEAPIYYQHCPMANGGKGANWLSKENEVKNPYYGSKMLTCGETIEIIK